MTDETGFRVSRRAALWAGVSAPAATLIPARAGAQPKIAPKLVQYQEKPKGPQECDNCLQNPRRTAVGRRSRAGSPAHSSPA